MPGMPMMPPKGGMPMPPGGAPAGDPRMMEILRTIGMPGGGGAAPAPDPGAQVLIEAIVQQTPPQMQQQIMAELGGMTSVEDVLGWLQAKGADPGMIEQLMQLVQVAAGPPSGGMPMMPPGGGAPPGMGM